MAKKKKTAGTTITRLHSVARNARTVLASKLLDHGFYAGQDQIMLALGQADGQTPGELAEKIGVRPPTVTKTINRLSEQGFVDRRASAEDGRQSHVFLTDAGRSALSAIKRAVRKTEENLLSGLTKKDRKRLRKLLVRLEANLA
ncbi:MAG: MarR family winged helix-turn-helix transcriptional regulator [Rhizobiaceae bacterium]